MQRPRESEKAACSRNCKYVKHFSVGWRWGPAAQACVTRTASQILRSGRRGAAGQQGTANRQVAVVGHSSLCLYLGTFPSQGHHTDTPGWLGQGLAPTCCVIIPNCPPRGGLLLGCPQLVRGPLRLTPTGLGIFSTFHRW